jgi:hypothetical protein
MINKKFQKKRGTKDRSKKQRYYHSNRESNPDVPPTNASKTQRATIPTMNSRKAYARHQLMPMTDIIWTKGNIYEPKADTQNIEIYKNIT